MTTKHLVQRTCTTGSLRFTNLPVEGAEPFSLTLVGDQQAEVPNEEIGKYLDASNPNLRYITQTERQHEKAQEARSEWDEGGEELIPGQPARVFNEKGGVDLISQPERASRPLSKPNKAS